MTIDRNTDTQSTKVYAAIIVFCCILVIFGSYLWQSSLQTAVAKTLTALPTSTVIVPVTPKPTNTLASTLAPISTMTPFSRLDLIGASLPYVMSELEKEGFVFDPVEGQSGSREVRGRYQAMLDPSATRVDLVERQYALVYAAYYFSTYLSWTLSI